MFTNPVIVTIALIELCSGFIRGAVMKWGYFFVNETAVSETKPFLTQHWGAALFCAGIFGGVFAGVVSDRIFNSRRGPSAGILYGVIIVTVCATLAFIGSSLVGYLVVFAILAVIGVHGMLAGTASMDFGGRKNAGVAVGLIDGMVYLGFGLQSVLLGMWLPEGDAASDPENWRVWMYTVLPAAVIGFVLCLRIWNAKPVIKAAQAKSA
jgi:OPA family glycerol-3-phosphate transporter-like MFS transporter